MSTGLPGLQPGLTKALTDMPQSAAGPSISSSERASALRAAENSFAKAIKILTEPLNLTREVLDALGEKPEGPVHPVSHLQVPGDDEQQHPLPSGLIESGKSRPAGTSGAEVVNDHIPQHRSAGPGVGDVEIGPSAGVFHASPSFDARPGAADTASVGEPGSGDGELPGPGTTTGGDQ